MPAAQLNTTAHARTHGLALLAVAVIGWGSNWPPLKLLLAELPPMAARAWPGLLAAALLAVVVRATGTPLRVPLGLWPRLWLAALLNITAWMGLATLSLGWLSASEGAIVAYTMPVWAALLAWPVLGEVPTPKRLAALALSMAGVVLVIAGKGIDIGLAKLPGVGFSLAGCSLFALGTVMTKRWPLAMPPGAAVAWQVGLGMVPLAVATLAFETPDWAAVSTRGWVSMAYMAALPLCLCYLAWFAALRRLPAGLATQGTLLAPVVSVVGAALFLGEPFGIREVASLALVLGGVVLAVRG
jgi:drug/metabolite transporter (DMT)-like permease